MNTAPQPTVTRSAVRPASSITENYRSIGPAAVLAALICMPKNRAKHVQPKPVSARAA